MTGLITTTMIGINGSWQSCRQVSFTDTSLLGSTRFPAILQQEEFQGALPLDPGIYRMFQGARHRYLFCQHATEKSDTVWHHPSEASWRSGRIPALPYPPIAGI